MYIYIFHITVLQIYHFLLHTNIDVIYVCMFYRENFAWIKKSSMEDTNRLLIYIHKRIYYYVGVVMFLETFFEICLWST